MTDIETEKLKPVDTRKKRYQRWLKVFFIIAILYTVWVIVDIVGIYYYNMGYRWAYLTMEQWIMSGIILIAVLLIIELIFFVNSKTTKAPKQKPLQPQKHEVIKSQEYHGKKLYVFTYPRDVKGGIFSRTFIPLDDNTLLQVRTQMKPAEQLWGKQQ